MTESTEFDFKVTNTFGQEGEFVHTESVNNEVINCICVYLKNKKQNDGKISHQIRDRKRYY